MQDWRSHAIERCRDHPSGVNRAQCGHLLLGVVALQERPVAAPCPTCATLQLELVQAALDRAAAALGEARSTGRDPALAENLVRAAHAACRYSWRMPPRRSCRRMSI